MNKLTTQRRAEVVRCLVEGVSMRATSRMTGVARQTIADLLIDLGYVCDAYQDKTLRNLPCKRVECDEIWSFVKCKAKNVPEHMRGTLGIGDVWTWTAICADTKVVPCWAVGERTSRYAHAFMRDLAGRLSNRVQLSTDGNKHYLNAVESAFGPHGVDYGMLQKTYGIAEEGPQTRYSPAVCTGAIPTAILGDPDVDLVSTSYVERQNLTMRMNMRRFTRLTNGHSKKLESHQAAVALHFMVYNFVRIHQTLRVTPAMEAGVSEHPWSIEEVVRLLDAPVGRLLAA